MECQENRSFYTEMTQKSTVMKKTTSKELKPLYYPKCKYNININVLPLKRTRIISSQTPVSLHNTKITKDTSA